MHKTAVLLWTMTLLAALPGSAQPLADRMAAQNFEVGGIRFYGLTVFGGYTSSAYPLTASGSTTLSTPNSAGFGPDENYGITGTFGWQYHRQRTDLSLIYSGSYEGMKRYSGLNTYSHSLSLVASRALTPRLRFILSGFGEDTSLAQFLFQPSTYLTQAPSSFDDLAAAASIGQFSNSQIAAMLTGSPILESPASTSIMGSRVLSYSLQTMLTYSASSRLQFHLASVSAGGQSRSTQLPNGVEESYRLPRSLAIDAGGGFSYSLSPRTEVGVNATATRITNLNQHAYSTTASGFIGRKMGQHWFLQVRGGGAMTGFVHQSYGAPKTRQIVGGGTIGFRTHRNSLIASYDRAAADSYGFAVGTMANYSGSWFFHPPGSRWTVFTTYTEQQMRNTGFNSLSGWQAGGGVTENLGDRMTLTAQYVYFQNSGAYMGSLSNFAIHGIRISLGWRPQAASAALR